MSQPTVAAVMLVNGREAMVRRAVECVRAQTYPCTLVMLDTAEEFYTGPLAPHRVYRHRPGLERSRKTIGELRNAANYETDADIIVHFDSDDYSHPRRVEEQVALLEATGADAVGYNEALFWRETAIEEDHNCDGDPCCAAEALLYSNRDPGYCLGASLAYWRKAWEQKPFRATSQGEDFWWCAGLRTRGVSSLFRYDNLVGAANHDAETAKLGRPMPRFIARIHAGNTSNAYTAETLKAAEWRRAPEWDAYCRERMAL